MIANNSFQTSFEDLIDITQKIANLELDQEKQRVVYFAKFCMFKNAIINKIGYEPIINAFKVFATNNENNLKNVIFKDIKNSKWLKDDSKVDNIFEFTGKDINKLCKGNVIYLTDDKKHYDKCLAVTEFYNFASKYRTDHNKDKDNEKIYYIFIFLEKLFETMYYAFEDDSNMQKIIKLNTDEVSKQLFKFGYKNNNSSSNSSTGFEKIIDINTVKQNKDNIVNALAGFGEFLGLKIDSKNIGDKFDTLLSDKNIAVAKDAYESLTSGITNENILEQGIENLHKVTGKKEVKDMVNVITSTGKEIYNECDIDNIGDKLQNKIKTIDFNDLQKELSGLKEKIIWVDGKTENNDNSKQESIEYINEKESNGKNLLIENI